MTKKAISVRFAEKIEGQFALDGVEVLKSSEYGVKLQFQTDVTPVEKVIEQLMVSHSVVDITVQDPPMEEIIRSIYEKPPDGPGEDSSPGEAE